MRRNIHAKDIIHEALKRVEPVRISKRELIKMVGLRKTVFLKALSELVEGAVLARSGTGRKRDPFKYGIAYLNGSIAAEGSPMGTYPSRKKMFFSY